MTLPFQDLFSNENNFFSIEHWLLLKKYVGHWLLLKKYVGHRNCPNKIKKKQFLTLSISNQHFIFWPSIGKFM